MAIGAEKARHINGGRYRHARKRQAQGTYLMWYRNTGDPEVGLRACVEAGYGTTKMQVANWRHHDPYFKERYEGIERAQVAEAGAIVEGATVRAAKRYVALLDSGDEKTVEKVARTLLLSRSVIVEKTETKTETVVEERKVFTLVLGEGLRAQMPKELPGAAYRVVEAKSDDDSDK